MAIVGSNILAGASGQSGGAAAGYEIERSLRFNSADTPSLTRAITTGKTTWTLSLWVKRTNLSGYQCIFSSGASSPNATALFFDNGTGSFYGYGSGGANHYSTELYRDFSAWYHIVISVSGNNGTVYVNGQSVTFSPALTFRTLYSNAVLGTYGTSGSYYFDGYMADVHFIDGQALDATDFGEFDATTGAWNPIEYTGTYGTDGAHLKFDNTADLGEDAAGSNDWTVNNITASVSNYITFPESNSPTSIDYLVIGGGGGGGAFAYAGGGGAGGYLEGSLSVSAGSSYLVTVGEGGGEAQNGEDSVLGSLVAYGGGYGGSFTGGDTAGGDGGSGGGSNYKSASWGSGVSGQGNDGGNGNSTGGGGGGGANAAGSAGSGLNGGAGGSGKASSITGTSVTRAGGGGGGAIDPTGTAGAAGAGGGGTGGGGGSAQNPSAGQANTGGGGGGASYAGTRVGANGGSGVVIIRYSNTYDDLTIGSNINYTATNTGGYKIYTFTSNGTAEAKDIDSLLDSPTNGTQEDSGAGGEVSGGYCVWNPLNNPNSSTFANGNLEVTTGDSGYGSSYGTMAVSSGKWYWEIQLTTFVTTGIVGIIETSDTLTSYLGGTANSYAYFHTGQKYNNGSGASYGATYTTNDIIGVALDMDAGTLVFYRNGQSQGTAYTGLSGTFMPGVSDGGGGSNVYVANFGQRPFSSTNIPSGFKALCTANLPDPTIADGSTAMDVVTYSGNSSSQTISGLNFSPDLVWIKCRSTAYNHAWNDTVRGALELLSSSMTDAEYTDTTGVDSFTSDGWTFNGTGFYNVNGAGDTYVGWAWDGGSSTVSNTDGSISSQVRANASAGFSIVSYTGDGTVQTIGHGLGVAPSMIICKKRDAAASWAVYHESTGNTGALLLNVDSAFGSGISAYWNNTSPTSSVFTTGGSSLTGDANNYVAYCWAPVEGYSAFGSYTGNGSSDGPFVYTGHRSRWIMFKRTDSSANWRILDTARDTYNVASAELYPNLSNAEGSYDALDIASNGFKLRNYDASYNASGGTYIFASFAEHPFKTARAR